MVRANVNNTLQNIMPYRLPLRGLYGIFFYAMNEIKVLAERNGRQHEFTSKQWAALPNHKYGWQEISRPVPPVVKESLEGGVKHKEGRTGRKKKSETIV